MADIFLSYRRQDSQSATGRLADRLEEHFGPARVFRDHESIIAGEDFAEAIRRSVASSTVVLVIIGPRWLEATSAAGARRLEDPTDFVRLEIELALAADVAVVPVLVEGSAMPASTALPASLAEFARCQAVELSDTRWRYDADNLIGTLQARFAIESEQALIAGSAADDGWLAWATRIAIDLLDLATHPTRMIARQQTGRVRDHLRAFLFLLASLLAGNLSLLIGLDIHPSPGTLLAGPWFGLLSWLANGEFVGVMVVALLAVPLTFAWRLTRTRVEFRQVTLVFAYVYSGAWLGLCAGALLLGAGVQIADPTLFDRMLALMNTAGSPATPNPFDTASAALAGSLHGTAAGLVAIGSAIWTATAIWAVVAWGAFRNAFGVGRVRSTMAALLWLGMLVAVATLLQRLG